MGEEQASMTKIGMIADDLTGANDSGVQLVKKGLRSSVIFDLNPLAAEQISNGAIVIDTDSRAISKEHSYEAVKKASFFLKDHGYTHIYKKVDSTLRGNIGIEIKAIDDTFDPDFCIIAPAFPRIGRTTRDGIHYLNGVPISETEISRDPKSPVTESSICELLNKQVGEKVGLVKTTELDNDIESWKQELTKWKEQGVKWLVFDALEDEHLERIAEHVSKITTNVVWVGSAGLAEYLPDKLGLTVSVNLEKKESVINQGVLVVSGSLSGVTKNQVSKLIEMDSIKAVEVEPLDVFEENEIWLKKKNQYIHQLISVYKEGKDAVLYVDSTTENRQNTAVAGDKLGLSPSEISNQISRGLGEIASEFVKSHSYITGLVLTGGDTAKDVCRQIGASGLELIKEVEPGIPLGKLAGEYELLAITKAGAFGNENSLVNAVLNMKGE